MRVEPRGWAVLVDECGQPEGNEPREGAEVAGQVVGHPENARVGCLAEDQGEWRSGRLGWGDNRAVRGEPDRQPVQTVESHVVRVILSWAGSDGGNTEAGGTRILGIPNVADRVAQAV